PTLLNAPYANAAPFSRTSDTQAGLHAARRTIDTGNFEASARALLHLLTLLHDLGQHCHGTATALTAGYEVQFGVGEFAVFEAGFRMHGCGRAHGLLHQTGADHSCRRCGHAGATLSPPL